jgi:penicillin amidase
VRNVLMDHRNQGRWCDNRETPARESCADILQQSLHIALDDLAGRYGDDMVAWTWGDAHRAVSVHQPFSKLAALRPFFEISVPSAGSLYTVNAGRFRMSDAERPFANTHAAAYRGLYDMADPDASRFIQSTGQSGNPLSPYYDNLAALWADGSDLSMSMDAAEYEPTALGTLTLLPANRTYHD